MDRTEAFHGGAHTSCAHVRGQGNAAEVPHYVLSSPLLSDIPQLLLSTLSPLLQLQHHNNGNANYNPYTTLQSTTTNSTFHLHHAISNNSNGYGRQFNSIRRKGVGASCRRPARHPSANDSRPSRWPREPRTTGGDLSLTGPAAHTSRHRKPPERGGSWQVPFRKAPLDGGNPVVVARVEQKDSTQEGGFSALRRLGSASQTDRSQ